MKSGQSFTGWLPLQKEHTCARVQPLSVQRPQFQSLQIGLLMCTLNLAEGRTSDKANQRRLGKRHEKVLV